MFDPECILRLLNEAGVAYLVIGGLASNLHGYDRATGEIEPGFIPVVGIDDLVRMKRVASRQKDLADLPDFEKLRELRNESG